jgi:hypothetical protein
MTKAFAAIVWGFSVVSIPASAAEITTAEMGNTANYLVTEATCEEVTHVISTSGMESSHDRMMMLAIITFQYGYAHGREISFDEAVREMLIYCMENPDELFAGFPD